MSLGRCPLSILCSRGTTPREVQGEKNKRCCLVVGVADGGELISQKVFIKSFCKSQFPHKSINLFFIITNIKNELTGLRGGWLMQNDFINTFSAINLRRPGRKACPCGLPHSGWTPFLKLTPKFTGYKSVNLRAKSVNLNPSTQERCDLGAIVFEDEDKEFARVVCLTRVERLFLSWHPSLQGTNPSTWEQNSSTWIRQLKSGVT